MKQPLSSWMGEEFHTWLVAINELPICNALFLEVHPTFCQPRCDIVTRLMASDGTLSAILSDHPLRKSPVWGKTLGILAKWQQQLDHQVGTLRTSCFAMWLEFDLFAKQSSPGDPAVFIALTPQADIGELAGELADYPEFQQAIVTSMRLVMHLRGSDSLILGHIGFMAPRQREDSILPLRSCWRCKNIAHFYEVLSLAGNDFDRSILQNQIRRLNDVEKYINSFMLDLDSRAGFRSDFALEVNVFNSRDASPERENVLLDMIVGLGFMSIAQKRKLIKLSNRYLFLDDKQSFDCSLHHIKFGFSKSRLHEVKCYWFVSANKQCA
jgi:hypothetical protein